MAERILSAKEVDALRALRAAGQPMSAYDILDALRRTHPTAAAPSAYRALSGLIARGLVHRLESINAYVACCSDEPCEAPLFAICDQCGGVDETSDRAVASDIAAAARRGGFVPQKSVIELIGRCASCQDAN